MTDAVWIGLFAMVAAICASTIAQPIMLWVKNRNDRMERDASNARADVLTRRLDETLEITKSTHAFVNSSYTEILKALLARGEQVLVFQKGASGERSEEEASALVATEKEITRLTLVIKERTDIATSEITKGTAANRSADAAEKMANETKRIADAAKGAAQKPS